MKKIMVILLCCFFISMINKLFAQPMDDIVERKNLISQNFTTSDKGLKKGQGIKACGAKENHRAGKRIIRRNQQPP